VGWFSPLQGVFGFVFPFLDSVPIIRAILGFALVFFLPGFAWTLVFFRQVNVVERVALSIGLSIALVTLSILSLNRLLGMSITGVSSVVVIVVITVIPVVIYYLRKYLGRVSRQE